MPWPWHAAEGRAVVSAAAPPEQWLLCTSEPTGAGTGAGHQHDACVQADDTRLRAAPPVQKRMAPSRARVASSDPDLIPSSRLCFVFPAQARIVGLNAQYFLKNGGHFVISIKASCIDSTAKPEAVFAREVRTRIREGVGVLGNLGKKRRQPMSAGDSCCEAVGR